MRRQFDGASRPQLIMQSIGWVCSLVSQPALQAPGAPMPGAIFYQLVSSRLLSMRCSGPLIQSMTNSKGGLRAIVRRPASCLINCRVELFCIIRKQVFGRKSGPQAALRCADRHSSQQMEHAICK